LARRLTAAGPPPSGGDGPVPVDLEEVVRGGDEAPFRSGRRSAASVEHRLDELLALGVERAAGAVNGQKLAARQTGLSTAREHFAEQLASACSWRSTNRAIVA
jgi:hypothetical protein